MPTIKAIRETMVEMLNQLHDATTKHHTTDDALARAIARIATGYKKLLDAKTENLNTRGTSYSVMNQLVVRLFGKKFYGASINVLKLDKEQMEHIKGVHAANTVHRNENREVIDGKVYHALISELKSQPRIADLATCLALATGRRPGEISRTATFAVLPEKKENNHCVWFTGQLKKRGKQDDGYAIPVLVLTPKECVFILHKLRDLQKQAGFTSQEQQESRTSAAIGRMTRAAFGPSISPETIRGAYAFICYRIYSMQTVPEALYDARILGHGSASNPDTTVSANHYQRATVVHWPGAPIPDLFLDKREVAARYAKESSANK
jgi:telomere resolvase